MSFAPSLTQTSPVRRGRTDHIALWAVQLALAAMFLLAGGSKLLGVLAMVAVTPWPIPWGRAQSL